MKETWRTDNNRSIGILRISSQRQKDGISHDTQEREIKDYCIKNNLQLVKVEPIIESAKNSDDRKKFKAAIASMITLDVRHVLFYMYDRETRNLTDNETNEKLVKSGLIVIHYVRENKVLWKESPDSEFFIRDVQAAANKQFSRNLSAKVGDSQLQKAKEGWFPGNHTPLGYIHIKRKDSEGRELKRGSTIGIDFREGNVKLAKREFELRSLGYSLDQIKKFIIEEGILPQKLIGKYYAGSIDKRLKNPFYWGSFTWKGQIYKGNHEVFIPKEILDRVEAINSGKRVYAIKGAHGIFGGGFVKCICGCNIVYDPKKKIRSSTGQISIFHYYHCTNGKKLHLSQAGMNISEELLWEQFDRAVDSITITSHMARQIAEELNKSHRHALNTAKKRIEETKALVDAIEQKEQRAYEDFTSEILDKESYLTISKRLKRDKFSLRNELNALQTESQLFFRENVQSTLELASSAKSLYLSRSAIDKRKLLEMLVSNPILDGITLQYDLKKPFGLLAKMKEIKEWRPLVDDFRTEIAEAHVGMTA